MLLIIRVPPVPLNQLAYDWTSSPPGPVVGARQLLHHVPQAPTSQHQMNLFPP